jgi:hypothetical protein
MYIRKYTTISSYTKSRFLYSTLVFIPLLGAVSSPYLVFLINITTKQHMIVIGARTVDPLARFYHQTLPRENSLSKYVLTI